MLNRWIEPASDITFISPVTGLTYTELSMAQVKKLRRRGRLDSTLKYRRARHARESRVTRAALAIVASAARGHFDPHHSGVSDHAKAIQQFQ